MQKMAQHEMEKKLNNVFDRHPSTAQHTDKLMNDSRLGFEPHEKKAVEDHTKAGGKPQESMSKSIVTKGPKAIQELHSAAKDIKELAGFADDLAKEFHLK